MNVLIVDDDVVLGCALSRALRQIGYACRVVSTVEMALRSLAAERPSLLITDFDLGDGCDGVALAGWARNGFGIPVLLMTGHDPIFVRAELAAAGLDDLEVLFKPFPLDALAAAIARQADVTIKTSVESRPSRVRAGRRA